MKTTENNNKDKIVIQKEKQHWLWFVYGALYGVFLRFLFGVLPSSIEGPMSVAFLITTPLVVGALTIYGYRGQKLRMSQLIFYPWLTIALLLLGSAIAMLEGLICIVIMTPLFLLFASIGGLLMAGCLHYLDENTKPLLSIALLPYLVFFTEPHLELSNKNIQIVESVIVKASPETIWAEIMTAKEIKADELPLSFSHIIGVPKPLEGLNVEVSGQEVRYSIWEKGVNFKANVTHSQENQYIKWDYVFDENSFPKGSMDDHVEIGGTYFDLHDTAFTLSPISPDETKLTITANYHVNSAINFYAIPVSQFLGADFVKTILGLYKHRSEA
ncbi:hypothetical protein [Marinicella rhabdoformis]|uniref:hypothetical protein n=1 Tax=Marinicella rhabdoformis TaxID=2580566 RepID=UPI0012AED6AA|nr:hypothetical protein [Marinicella rhabdoformis]